jgi:MerR family transcriptional regulator, heat shock protein HspR
MTRGIDTSRIKSYIRIMAGRKRQELFLISMAAEMLDMHPQTLRKYERLGLVRPLRTLGSMRVYTREELDRVRLIKSLVDDAGINLAGVQRLLSVAEVVQRLRPLVLDDLSHAARSRGRRSDVHRRLTAELDELFRILGMGGTR